MVANGNRFLLINGFISLLPPRVAGARCLHYPEH